MTDYISKFVPGLDKLSKTPGFDTVVGETMGAAKKARPLSKAEKKKKKREEEVKAKRNPQINIPEEVANELKEEL